MIRYYDMIECISLNGFRTTAQFFQVVCEEIMERAKRQIDVDKIFAVKPVASSSGGGLSR